MINEINQLDIDAQYTINEMIKEGLTIDKIEDAIKKADLIEIYTGVFIRK